MYLGIDQSLNHTGVCILGDRGDEPRYLDVIEPKGLRGVERLAYVWDAVERTIAKYSPFYAAMEGYAYGVGVGRVFELGEVGGTAKLCMHRHSVPFLVVTPTQLKKFVTDNGSADKEKMMLSTKVKWKQVITDDNACDAYGLARVARAWHKDDSAVRCELEVLKALRDQNQLVSAPAKSRTKLSL
jgi:crossover junction endodeoxyribonuclease RuvC